MTVMIPPAAEPPENKENLKMAHNVLAIAEIAEGTFRKITFEVVSEGKRIATQLGGQLAVLVMAADGGEIAPQLAGYGADQILVADHPDLATYLTSPFTQVAADVITERQPAVVMLGASTQGKDLSARLAARLQAPLAMDCVALQLDNDRIRATRPIYGGKVLADVTLSGDPQMVTLRPNAAAIVETQGAGTLETLSVDPGPNPVTLVERNMVAGKAELTEADVIVSGGRGMGGPDYSIIEALAEQLDGAVGASRSAVDEGWRPFADQVGQTGKVVSPNLYIACGISGAIQHLAGMQTSKVVVAINKDADAPIFQKADYGIVGNLFDIVPLITEGVIKLKD